MYIFKYRVIVKYELNIARLHLLNLTLYANDLQIKDVKEDSLMQRFLNCGSRTSRDS